jgi:hypothetical protein
MPPRAHRTGPDAPAVVRWREGESRPQAYSLSTDYTEPIPDDVTNVRVSPGKGLGLFSARRIPKGEVVARMRQPGRMQKRDWETFHVERDLPHDAAVALYAKRLMFYDQSWWDGYMWDVPVPKWYRMNHSPVSNAHMHVIDPDTQQAELVWVASEPVAADTEITFDYGIVPEEWNDVRR